MAPRFIALVFPALFIYILLFFCFFFVAGASCTLTLLQLSHGNIFSFVVILAQFVFVCPHCLGPVLLIFILVIPLFFCTFSMLFLYLFCTFYLWLVQQNISASGV